MLNDPWMLLFYRNAYEVRHRVKSSEFLHTTSSLIRTLDGYLTFRFQTHKFTQQFQELDVSQYIAAITALGDQLQYDMDHVLFDGVYEISMTSIIYQFRIA